MKKCPSCAEEIQEEAIKCRFCGFDLNTESQSQFKIIRKSGSHTQEWIVDQTTLNQWSHQKKLAANDQIYNFSTNQAFFAQQLYPHVFQTKKSSGCLKISLITAGCLFLVFCVSMFIFLMFMGSVADSISKNSNVSKAVSSEEKTSPEPKVSSEETQKIQKKRKEIIDKIIKQGVITKIEIPGNLPHMWITPLYKNLDYDLKVNFANLVYSYYVTENSSYDMVIFKDSKTGQRIGGYSPEIGLDLKN
jgi:hypothetical protein